MCSELQTRVRSGPVQRPPMAMMRATRPMKVPSTKQGVAYLSGQTDGQDGQDKQTKVQSLRMINRPFDMYEMMRDAQETGAICRLMCHLSLLRKSGVYSTFLHRRKLCPVNGRQLMYSSGAHGKFGRTAGRKNRKRKKQRNDYSFVLEYTVLL